MAKSIEVASDGAWFLKHVETEDDAVFVKLDDKRFVTKGGHLTEKIIDVKPSKHSRGYQGFIVINFSVPTAAGGNAKVRFDLGQFHTERSSFGELLGQDLSSVEFCSTLKKILEGSKNVDDSSMLAVSPPNTPKSSAPSGTSGLSAKATKKRVVAVSPSNTPKSSAPSGTSGSSVKPTKKRVVASTSSIADNVDLPSPSKKAKIPATDIDQRVDSHYLGHINLNVDQLNDSCPESWLDRPINQAHVSELATSLERTPTLAKSMQSWVAIADISKKDLKTKDLLKGCRITVIGGRHRQAAYKKVRNISDTHHKELEKVWVHIYDNKLTEDEMRRLAAIHNIGNVGSMNTPWMTRVHACREWLYKKAQKNIHHDETPSSTQAWKIECQSMYVPKDKDPNTLEPTLQAALLRRDVYEEFRKVGEMFSRHELKDQRRGKRKSSDQIPQSKLGMPLQGLADKTKKEVLQEVTRKELSLKELQQKCKRIKKKQLVVNAFLKHAGESSYDELHSRFPLHATEEKLAQFSSSLITKKFTPQEVTAFFERALEWENNKKPSTTLNLHEEREGVYFFVKGENSGVLMNGSMASLPLEKLKTMMIPRSFKGFSLVLALITKETTKSELMLLLTSIHATNVDMLQTYNVVLVHEDSETITMTEEALSERMTHQQCAFWVNTKFQKLQGYVMANSVKTISIGHWSKDNTLSDANCHFKTGESGSNAFCFEEEEEGRLPTSLSNHIIKHFSFEGQWVLDVTQSKDSGIVAALASERNCVSLMNADDLRDTAKAATNTMSKQNNEDESVDIASVSEDDE